MMGFEPMTTRFTVWRSTKLSYKLHVRCCAEAKGLEPLRPCGPPVFKTGALTLSAKPPDVAIHERLELPTQALEAPCSNPLS